MKYILLLVILINAAGCSFFKGKPKPVEPTMVAAVAPEPILKNGRILDPERVRAGGRILVVPFTPGTHVAATEDFDRVSLMIVQGMAESLSDSQFTVLDAGNSDTADLILQGRILAMKESGRLKKWTTLKNKKYITVEGKIVDANSGETIVHFTETKESQNKKQTFAELGASIGQNIGKFLSTSIN